MVSTLGVLQDKRASDPQEKGNFFLARSPKSLLLCHTGQPSPQRPRGRPEISHNKAASALLLNVSQAPNQGDTRGNSDQQINPGKTLMCAYREAQMDCSFFRVFELLR